MPIPPFDGILNVLPPHLGNPTDRARLSPYLCTTTELIQQLSFTAARRTILRGLLQLRRDLLDLGIYGFQWLDGSFLEDIEASENREPRDIDTVTFVATPHAPQDAFSAMASRPELLQRPWVKLNYRVDHFLLSMGSDPEILVEYTRYYYGLFSHRRAPDRTWKGMLRINLAPNCDDAAWQLLGPPP